MWTALLAALQAIPSILALVNRAVTAWENQVAVNKANAQLQWAQSLQSGLQPLESGLPATDAERAAAVKAVADAWARLP